ncbi:hypothetical protein ACH4TP_37880 [Streptomyces sp. NPDC021012]|uniref:hypothetical protein n=1 Tax=Streptomyces sp. NPDC021012 TaxID=3365107 RepID=UPI00379E75E9
MTRGRGRPITKFTAETRQRFLDQVAAGARLADAAQNVGVHHNVPHRTARTDPAFAEALATAKARGRAARQDERPHDESRYNHQACRCDTCRAAATTARTARRTTDDSQVLDLDANREPPTSCSAPCPSSGTARAAA